MYICKYIFPFQEALMILLLFFIHVIIHQDCIYCEYKKKPRLNNYCLIEFFFYNGTFGFVIFILFK